MRYFPKKIFIDFFSVFSAISISRIVLFFREFLLADAWTPAEYGNWTQAILVLGYGLYLPLGFQNMASRAIPFYHSQGSVSKAAEYRFAYKHISLVSTTTAFVALLVYGVFVSRANNGLWLAIGLSLLFQQWFSFGAVILKAEKRFQSFSIGSIVQAAASTLLVVGLARYDSAFSVVGHGIAFLVVAGYWSKLIKHRSGKHTLPFFPSKKLFIEAIPLFLSGFATYLLVTIDRLWVALFFGSYELGLYGFAFAANQAIHLIVSPIHQTFSPRLMEALAKKENPTQHERVIGFFFLLSIGAGVAISGVSVIGVIFFQFVVPAWFPDYVGSLSSFRILLSVAAVLSVASGANAILIAMWKAKVVVALQSLTVTALAVALLAARMADNVLTSIPLAKLLVVSVYTVVTFVLAAHLLHTQGRRTVLWGSAGAGVMSMNTIFNLLYGRFYARFESYMVATILFFVSILFLYQLYSNVVVRRNNEQ